MLALTAGILGITTDTTVQLAFLDRVLLTVLSVRGSTAIVSINNRNVEVQTEIPLRPGQTLYVSPEQGGRGEIRLRLIGEATSTDVSGIPSRTFAAKQLDLPTAFRLAELPVTTENTNSVNAAIRTLGELTLPNLLAAVSMLKAGLVSSQLLDSVASFLERLLASLPAVRHDVSAKELDSKDAGSGKEVRDAVLVRSTEMAKTLQRLPSLLGGSGLNLEAALKMLFSKSGASAQQLLGSQVYTWTQGDQEKPCYYLPLFTCLNGYGLHHSELFIYPAAEEDQGGPAQQPWLFILTLETDALGWMQFKMAYLKPRLSIQALAERLGTKQVLDDNWQLLADSLGGLNLQLSSHQCEIGPVASQVRRLHEIKDRFDRYDPFDISI